MKLTYIYYLLMCVCFINSLFYLHRRDIRILSALLLISIITEAVVEYLLQHQLRYYRVYHIFNIAEYTLTTLMLREEIPPGKIRQIMLWSILPFASGSLLVSCFIQPWNRLPSISNDFECLFIVSWCIIALLSIEPENEQSILIQPKFWFIISFYIYFIGTISFNGIFNFLTQIKSQEAVARSLFSIINSACNYLLYVFMLVGFSMFRWKKSMQLS